ncbi:COR domain-containing protein [Candidatus Electronema sp. PJ]|uniref:COR domain-containing protein n=1 Tax=Candidatus Electronema sp. PJ TaxID=3401572 RepID=UPI003AA7F18E
MNNEEVSRLIKEAVETGETELALWNQGLTELPPELFWLTKLNWLDLGGNQLIELPPEIVQLTNLTGLNLSNNQLATFPPELFQLTKLNWLALSGNQLTSLLPEFVNLPKLKVLLLHGNPLVSPPLEIANRGIEAIRSYFASLEGESRLLAEVKVILVGEGAAGKTSLTRCLRDERFNPKEETTHGIRIRKWQINSTARPIRCNLWDFGGQEIMHATHQFFLSRRSLYVLVLDGRQDNKAEYWLRYIETFGGDSPVLVVLNKYDANPSFDVDRIALHRKFPFIKGFWRTSCNTGQGIDEFRQALHEELGNVQFIETRWANAWFNVKERLEQMKQPCISYEEFEEICKQAEVSEKISRDVLLAFLHDLGIVIHFTEFALEENHVLDPSWVTEAVYKIINAKSIAEAKGLLRLHDLSELLAFKEGDGFRYERRHNRYFVDLMKKFELCYELPDEQIFIPQLLPVPEPSFTFDYENALRFVLHYEDFLPPAVMPRFIVKRHQEIHDNLQWRSGVVLKNAQLDASAAVRADNETRRIHIAVTGTERKVFLALIWLTLREINADFKGLKVSERVPMPNDPKRSVPYKTLITYREKGLSSYIPEDSEEVYSVEELLEAVHPDSASDEQKMLALAEEETKDRTMNQAGAALNTIFKLEPSLFGMGINLNAVFDYLLKRERK